MSDTYARNIVDNVDRAVNEADRLIHRTFYGCKGVVHGRLECAADCFTDICSDICKNALDRVPDPRKEGSNIAKHVFNIRVCFREFCVKP